MCTQLRRTVCIGGDNVRVCVYRWECAHSGNELFGKMTFGGAIFAKCTKLVKLLLNGKFNKQHFAYNASALRSYV